MVEAFAQVLRRFPLVMLAALLAAFCRLWLIESGVKESDVLLKLFFTAAIGVPLLLAGRLLRGDGTGRMWNTRLPEMAAVGVLVVLFFNFSVSHYHNLTLQSWLLFVLVNTAAHLLVAVGPFLLSGSDVNFWEYNKTLFINFTVGALYSMLLFAGLSLAIFIVGELFQLGINGKIYLHLFVLLAGVFNTAYFLYHFPEDRAQGKGRQPLYSTVFRNLIKYILLPIVITYFVILYAYALKILVQWELPKGWVGSLVLGFSLLGILTWLLNYFLEETDNSVLVAAYRRWFFPVLIPMTLLLFVGIGHRIADYGLTENRMVVASTGLWLLAICLYFILAKRPTLKAIPVSLIVLFLADAMGPTSASRLSARSQANRLQRALLQAGMWQDGKIVPTADSLEQDLAGEIKSLLNYMNNWEHMDIIQKWYDKLPEARQLSSYDLNEFKIELGLKKVVKKLNENFFFEEPDFVPTEGYDYLWHLDLVKGSYLDKKIIYKNLIVLELPDNNRLRVNLTPALRYCRMNFRGSERGMATEKGRFEFEQDGWAFRLHLRTLHVDSKENDLIYRLRGFLLGKKISYPSEQRDQ